MLRRLSRRIGVRVILFSLAAIVLSPCIPSDLAITTGSDAVDNILGIIASSMLTVTTFSLSTKPRSGSKPWRSRRLACAAATPVSDDLVDPPAPIAMVDGFDVDDPEQHVRDRFTIGDIRSHDRDLRFGASVLTEIASRARSPGINDPGTAIDVIGRAVRLLTVRDEPLDPEAKVEHPSVFAPPIAAGDLFDDLFTPIARDGASTVEIGVRLQKALRTLARYQEEGFSKNARCHSREALERAEAVLAIKADKKKLRALAAEVAKRRWVACARLAA